MNDTESILTQFGQQLKAEREANALNKTAVFDALAAAGITRVTAEFDGSGDSGQVQNISPYRGEEACAVPEIEIVVQDAACGSEESKRRTASLYHAIDCLCYD